MRDHAWHIRPPRGGAKGRTDTATWTHTVAERATPEWVQSLSRRLITAGIAIPVVLAMVWFGGWVTFTGALLIMGLGIYELDQMFRKIGAQPLTTFAFLVGTALLVGALFPTLRTLMQELTITALVLGSLSWLLLRRQAGSALMDWALTLVMSLYLAWPLSYLMTLRGKDVAYALTSNGLAQTAGTMHFWWLLVVFFGVWAFDSAAFFAGRFFGNHKLAPSVSPSKTWEGVIGGTLFAVAAAYVFTRPIAPSVAWYHAIALGLLISFAATIGDLAESLIKRQADVKDSGSFFWGHGGVLDRIDSLLFGGVVVYFYALLIIGKL
jgi:phosphatidate cytidylyltransferase